MFGVIVALRCVAQVRLALYEIIVPTARALAPRDVVGVAEWVGRDGPDLHSRSCQPVANDKGRSLQESDTAHLL